MLHLCRPFARKAPQYSPRGRTCLYICLFVCRARDSGRWECSEAELEGHGLVFWLASREDPVTDGGARGALFESGKRGERGAARYGVRYTHGAAAAAAILQHYPVDNSSSKQQVQNCCCCCCCWCLHGGLRPFFRCPLPSVDHSACLSCGGRVTRRPPGPGCPRLTWRAAVSDVAPPHPRPRHLPRQAYPRNANPRNRRFPGLSVRPPPP